jgi:hypothetical protein
MKKIVTLLVFMGLGVFTVTQAQISNSTEAMPQIALDFLTIPMDARSAGIGDIGVGTSPDAYSHQYNPSKYLFGNVKAGVNLSYSPWMRNLVSDMNIVSVGGFYKLDSLQSFSASFRFFSMGDMDFTENHQIIASKTAYQLAFDMAYARKLSQYFSLSVALRYAMADLYPSDGYKKGWAISGDIAAYFQKPVQLWDIPSTITAGIALTDIGTKVSFQDDGNKYFMPLTFKLGAGLSGTLAKNHKVMIAAEIARSMVPTSIKNRDKSSISGMFSSFSDGSAPTFGIGTEYGFKNMAFARFGYHFESEKWGNRQHVTVGAGAVYKMVRLDVAYLISTKVKHNAMGNTLRFSLAVDIDY